jgi:hypothetical protein
LASEGPFISAITAEVVDNQAAESVKLPDTLIRLVAFQRNGIDFGMHNRTAGSRWQPAQSLLKA